MNELECCPICGAEARLVKDKRLDKPRYYPPAYVECTGCGFRTLELYIATDCFGYKHYTVRDVINNWNSIIKRLAKKGE